MNDPSIPKNPSVEEVNALHQRLLKLEQSNHQYRQQIEQLTEQLTEERKARQLAEERWQLSLTSAEMVAWDMNLITDRVVCTPNALEVWGIQEGSGEDFFAVIHPDDRQGVIQAAKRAIAGETNYVREYRAIGPDGTIRWLNSRGRVYHDENGRGIRMIGLSVDVTERKQAEIALRESEEHLRAANERFQLAAKAVNSVIYDWHLEIDRIERTDGLTKLLGYSLEEIEPTAQWWRDRIHPDDLQPMLARALAALTKNDYFTAEYRIRNQSNQYIYVLDRGLVVARDARGNPLRIVGSTTDISDRKRVEDELRGSEQQLLLAQQAGKIGTWQWNLFTNEISWSNAIWTLLGLEPNSIALNPEFFINFIHPDDRERALKGVEVALALGDDYQDEFRVIRHDGTIRWLLSKGRVTRRRDGKPELLMGVNVDITDRKQAEAALAESNQTLQAIVQACPLAIMGLRADGTVRIWNPAAERIFGWSQQEAIGKFLPAIPEHKRSEFLDNLALTIQCQGLVGVETQRQKKGNVLFDVELWSAPVDETLAGISCLSVVADISERKRIEQERKQAEESLRQSEERYRYLVETIPQLVWTADAEGLPIDVNQRWSTFTGLTLAQARTEGWPAVVHPDDLAIWGENWTIARRNGTYYQAEARMRRSDGTYRWHLHQAIPLKNERGQPIKWFGTATDIEDQKQLEQQRIHLLQQEQVAREQAETANRIKDEFLAVLSHELRTPLNPIQGWARLLRTHKLDAKATDRALETIERNAKLQAQLIEDLLDVSRILQGKLKLDARPVKLSTTIEAALETVRLSAEAKNIEIQTVLNSQLGQVSGDANRLQQIVWNLLSNAIKFTPPGGRVEVRLESCQFSVIGSQLEDPTQNSLDKRLLPPAPPQELALLNTPNSRSYAQIQVSDTGQGISPDFLPHVFEYFRQADSSTTRQFGGLGLGLAIVRHLVELHGGTVKAESPGLGMGATFTVQLPLTIAIATSEPEVLPTRGIKNLKGISILIADDEADMRDLIRFILEQQGAKVTVTASATEALQRLAESMPDVLIGDIGMPEMDGYALMRQIRASLSASGQVMPAIALTAYAGDIDRRRSIEAGFQIHLAKPIEAEQLVKTVARLVARKFEHS